MKSFLKTYKKQLSFLGILVIIAALPLTLFLLRQNQDIRQHAVNSVWVPAVNTSWQWQLTGTVDQSLNVQMYDIDGFDNTAATVASLHAQGARVVCYISFGTYENWRPDANLFPAAVLGNSNGWPGEKWLDIRNLTALGPIIQSRMDMCQSKGFDAVEPDNIDGYTNNTGFPLTAQDQITFNTFLATQAHARGMSIGLKNDIDQLTQLSPVFDWALNEQCFQYNECDGYTNTFINAGKAVFEVEYSLATSQFCPQANALNFNALKKDLNLTATRTACRESGNPTGPVPTAPPVTNPTPTSTVLISPTPSTSVTANPTQSSGARSVALTVAFHGIGNAGDNANAQGGNTNPTRHTRQVSIETVTSGGAGINTTSGTVTYQSLSKNFTGSITLPISLTSGTYRFRISSPGYLTTFVPGVYTLSQSGTYILSPVTLTTGDSQPDNQLDVLDYNMIMTCWLTPTACSPVQKSLSDLDDNNVVDVIDYNLFIRELSVQRGL